MYRQILLDLRDLDYQRILWKRSPNDLPIAYNLLTVTYGMACAPFLALRVLKQLVSDEGLQFLCASRLLQENIYVDDVLFGGDDLDQLCRTRDELIALLRGGFTLREWASNSPLLLSDIESADHGLACSKSLSIDENIKILGINWNPSLDVFQMTIALDATAPDSKRSILSAIAKLYDPLGWVSPVTVTAKIFMQQIWRAKLNWDNAVPESLLRHWKLIYTQLTHLDGLQLPRWNSLGSTALNAELHGFSDASNHAYSAVVYLRVVSYSDVISVTLLAAKSKVAPLTPFSVPRLELSAAVFLLELVRNWLESAIDSCFCWTDSTIVLAWLNQHPSKWKIFIANRVADIQSRLSDVK